MRSFTLGDNVYTSGTTAQFDECFTPTWGDPHKRIIKNLHPAPGNHEYYTPFADPYYKYFGPAAGTVGKGYYSYDVGTWHVVVVNSEIIVNPIFTDSARQEQMDWVDEGSQGAQEAVHDRVLASSPIQLRVAWERPQARSDLAAALRQRRGSRPRRPRS